MKIDMVLSADLDAVGQQARDLHAMGFDGAYTQEANSDVMFPLLLAAQAAPMLLCCRPSLLRSPRSAPRRERQELPVSQAGS